MKNYPALLKEVKDRIRQAQIRATLSANAEMLFMYWEVDRIIDEQRDAEGWGAKVIQRLALDIRNELPEVKGFSERNLKRMLAFYKEYSSLQIGPLPVAQLPDVIEPSIRPLPVAQSKGEGATDQSAKLLEYVLHLPWAHNALLLGVKSITARLWYMAQTLEHGWSKDWLIGQIKGNAFERQGKAVTNFVTHLPAPQSALAQESLKDPYLFDFLTLEEPFHERELETGLVAM